MRRDAARILALWGLYAALLAWHTWPLAALSATHRAEMGEGSSFDALYSGWVLSWESYALTTAGVSLADANIYHPEPDALFYGPVALGALPFFAPLYLLTGNPTLALNWVLLGCISLSAAMVHFVVHRWTGWHSAALVAGVAFLANRWLLVTFVPRTPHIGVLCYFPLIILVAASADLRAKKALLLCGLVIAQGLTDAVYVAPAVLIPLTLLSVVFLARRDTRARGGWMLAVTVMAAIVLVAVHAPYLTVSERNPLLFEQTLWRAVPQRVHLSLPWGLMQAVTPLAIASLVPCLILAAGGIVLLRSWQGSRVEASAWRHALFWTTAGIAISLPLNVGWGEHFVRLPHLELLQSWHGVARVLAHPERLRVAALFGVVLLAGLAIAEILRHMGCGGQSAAARWGRGGVALALCAAFYVQFAWSFGQPAAYGGWLFSRLQLSRSPSDTPVLAELRRRGGPTIELPLTARRAPMTQATAMYRSIFHRQPLLNGYSSFWPAGFTGRMSLAARLPDAAALEALRRETGLAFVLVRKQPEVRAAAALEAQRQAWLEIAAQGGRSDLELIAGDDELLLFGVR